MTASTADSRLTNPHSQAKATISRMTAKIRALRGSMTPGDERAVLGALHEGVDVAVDVHVDGVGEPPAASVPPNTVANISHTDGRPGFGHHHRGHRGDQQELDDPRLGEGDVRTDLGAERWPSGCVHRESSVGQRPRRGLIRPRRRGAPAAGPRRPPAAAQPATSMRAALDDVDPGPVMASSGPSSPATWRSRKARTVASSTGVHGVAPVTGSRCPAPSRVRK